MTSRDESEPRRTRVLEQKLGALGDRVRVLRTSREWSQQELADRTGIGRGKISGIETGKRNITLEVLWRLADAFRVHWADLLDDHAVGAPRVQHASAPFKKQLKAFGDRVYQSRVLQRLSQQELTDRTRIGRSAISDIEVGAQNVTLETLHRLAVGLHVYWADLLDDRKSSPPQPSRSGT